MNTPFITFIYEGAPDALVYQICNAIVIQELDQLPSRWLKGIYTSIRLNDSWTNGNLLSWNHILEASNEDGCLSFSQDPTGISEGLATVQVFICDEKKNCTAGLSSHEVVVKISQDPFEVYFVDADSEYPGIRYKELEGEMNFDLISNRRKLLETENFLSKSSFCNLTPSFESNISTPETDSTNMSAVDTLIIYAFSHSDGWREDNLFFWLAKGLLLRGRYHFVVIVSGAIDESWRLLLDRLSAAEPAFEWHQRPDYGRDVCAWHAVLRGWVLLRLRLAAFARFVLLNASCRGPFLPPYYPHPWPEAFLSLLTGSTVLAGASIFCACARPEPRPGHLCIATPQLHVQSYLIAFGRPAFPEVLALQAAICAQTGGPTGEGGLHAWSFEMELTRRVLANGDGVAVTQYLWAGVDLRDTAAAARICADSVTPGGTGDPMHPGAYAGGDAHPLELVFFKTNRGVAEAELRRLTRAALAAAPWAVPRRALCGAG